MNERVTGVGGCSMTLLVSPLNQEPEHFGCGHRLAPFGAFHGGKVLESRPVGGGQVDVSAHGLPGQRAGHGALPCLTPRVPLGAPAIQAREAGSVPVVREGFGGVAARAVLVLRPLPQSIHVGGHRPLRGGGLLSHVGEYTQHTHTPQVFRGVFGRVTAA